MFLISDRNKCYNKTIYFFKAIFCDNNAIHLERIMINYLYIKIISKL